MATEPTRSGSELWKTARRRLVPVTDRPPGYIELPTASTPANQLTRRPQVFDKEKMEIFSRAGVITSLKEQYHDIAEELERDFLSKYDEVPPELRACSLTTLSTIRRWDLGLQGDEPGDESSDSEGSEDEHDSFDKFQERLDDGEKGASGRYFDKLKNIPTPLHRLQMVDLQRAPNKALETEIINWTSRRTFSNTCPEWLSDNGMRTLERLTSLREKRQQNSSRPGTSVPFMPGLDATGQSRPATNITVKLNPPATRPETTGGFELRPKTGMVVPNGGKNAMGNGSSKMGKGTDIMKAKKKSLSPWVQQYSSAPWRDKVLGLRDNVWDPSISKYRGSLLMTEFEKMAERWSCGIIDLRERTVSEWHSMAVKKYVNENEDIRVLNMANCGLSDDNATPFLSILADSRITDLDISGNSLGERSVEMLAEQLEQIGCPIINLRMNSNSILRPALPILVSGVQANMSVRELDVSNCKLTSHDVLLVCKILNVNSHLVKLNVSNNSFTSTSAMHGLCSAITTNITLQELDLSSTGLRDQGAQYLFDALRNSKIRVLNLNNNSVGKMACYAANNTLSRKHYLEQLYLRNNPLTLHGAIQLFLAMADSDTLKFIDIAGATFQSYCSEYNDFDHTNPVGSYRLLLEYPGHRAIAIKLVKHWYKYYHYSNVWKKCSLDGRVFELKDHMGWPANMPDRGVLCVDVIMATHAAGEPAEKIKTIDQELLDRLYFTPVVQDADLYWRGNYLKALSFSFHFSCKQIARMIKGLADNREGLDLVSLVSNFFPRPVDVENMGSINTVLGPAAWEAVQAQLGTLGTFNQGAPNGRYNLDLNDPKQRYFALKLQELERSEFGDGLLVSTMHHNACVRNINFMGGYLVKFCYYKWTLPRHGRLQFDYSTHRRTKNIAPTSEYLVELILYLLEMKHLGQYECMKIIDEFATFCRVNETSRFVSGRRASLVDRNRILKQKLEDMKAHPSVRAGTSKDQSSSASQGGLIYGNNEEAGDDSANHERIRLLHVVKVCSTKFMLRVSQALTIMGSPSVREHIVDVMIAMWPSIHGVNHEGMNAMMSNLNKHQQMEFGRRIGLEHFGRLMPLMWFKLRPWDQVEYEYLKLFCRIAAGNPKKQNFHNITIGGTQVRTVENNRIFDFLLLEARSRADPDTGMPADISFQLDISEMDVATRAALTLQSFWRERQRRLKQKERRRSIALERQAAEHRRRSTMRVNSGRVIMEEESKAKTPRAFE